MMLFGAGRWVVSHSVRKAVVVGEVAATITADARPEGGLRIQVAFPRQPRIVSGSATAAAASGGE